MNRVKAYWQRLEDAAYVMTEDGLPRPRKLHEPSGHMNFDDAE